MRLKAQRLVWEVNGKDSIRRPPVKSLSAIKPQNGFGFQGSFKAPQSDTIIQDSGITLSFTIHLAGIPQMSSNMV